MAAGSAGSGGKEAENIAARSSYLDEIELAQAKGTQLSISEHGCRAEDGGEGPRGQLSSAGSAARPGGFWWHVNKGGFPIPKETWERMWQHIRDVHPDGLGVAKSIRGQHCKKVPVHKSPALSSSTQPAAGVLAVQSYLQALQYNHTGTQFFDIKKSRPLSRLMETAKEIIQASIPIKCLEAVVVALYLTAPLPSVHRLAVSFKSKCSDMYYRHIVLAVCSGGSFGALGLSRRLDLMYKPQHYKSLSDLIQDYIQCYANYHHKVVKVRLSSLIPHNLHSCEQITWKCLSLNLSQMQDKEIKRSLDKFSRSVRTIHSAYT